MKLQIRRSIVVNKPVATVYAIISDLKQWNQWSPWIYSEPTAKTETIGSASTVGQSHSWDGEVIGAGKMTISSLQPNQSVSFLLEFFKPWKSVSQVQFSTEATSTESCTVTWEMNSTIPFFMFFFKKMMTVYMNNDFDRGLRMLKEYAETGAPIVSKTIYQNEQQLSAFQVMGVNRVCKISELSTVMPKDFEGLNAHMANLPTPNGAVAIYHKFDMDNGVCEYTAGVTFAPEQTVNAPTGYVVNKFPAHKGLVVDHYGPYRHLGNPWGMAMSYQRSKKRKLDKNVPMYERYISMPDGRPEKDIFTQILVPVK